MTPERNMKIKRLSHNALLFMKQKKLCAIINTKANSIKVRIGISPGPICLFFY